MAPQTDTKLDANLRRVLKKDTPETKYPVTISLCERVVPLPGEGRDGYKNRVRRALRPITALLRESGVRSYSILYLANAVSATLALEKIQLVEQLPEVKSIVLDKIEYVAL